MSAFSALMALSASNTREAESQVKVALAERERKEAAKRKEIEDRERKEREREAFQRKKHFEEQKRRALEEEKRLAQEESRAIERERQLAEQERMVRKGLKRASSVGAYPASKAARDRSSRSAWDDDNGDDPDETSVLTREEKRERKLKVQMAREFQAGKRIGGSHHNSHRTQKVGRRLPGGAVDLPSDSGANKTMGKDAHMSVKARLSAQPNTLQKLNLVKRDMRTIDEIMMDRAKAKEARTLDGDEALHFNGWFDDTKKSKSSSGSNSPLHKAALPPAQAKPTPKSAGPKSSGSKSASTKAVPRGRMSLSPSPPSQKRKPEPTTRALPPPKKRRIPSRSPSPPPRQRAGRTESIPRRKRSYSPPPQRRRPDTSSATSGVSSYRDEIWKMFGKDRSHYMARDIDSDDDDEMEISAHQLEREELRSARLGRKEDEAALREEMRREEEKRKRKMEQTRLAGRY